MTTVGKLLKYCFCCVNETPAPLTRQVTPAPWIPSAPSLTREYSEDGIGGGFNDNNNKVTAINEDEDEDDVDDVD